MKLFKKKRFSDKLLNDIKTMRLDGDSDISEIAEILGITIKDCFSAHLILQATKQLAIEPIIHGEEITFKWYEPKKVKHSGFKLFHKKAELIKQYQNPISESESKETVETNEGENKDDTQGETKDAIT